MLNEFIAAPKEVRNTFHAEPRKGWPEARSRLALAAATGLPAYTADRAWVGVEAGVEIGLIREGTGLHLVGPLTLLPSREPGTIVNAAGYARWWYVYWYETD